MAHESGSSAIADFFAGRSVFVTGATGFMGKVLVEKLLRSCPAVKCLYLLMRPTATKDIECRREELVNNPVRLRHPRALREITVLLIVFPTGFHMAQRKSARVAGQDCSSCWRRHSARIRIVDKRFADAAGERFNRVQLGGHRPFRRGAQRSFTDQCQRSEAVAGHCPPDETPGGKEKNNGPHIHVRFSHCARNGGKFNGSLSLSLSLISFDPIRLQAFVHVSTVFNNLDRQEIDEVIYPARIDPAKLIDFLDCVDNDLIRSITPQ